MIRARFCCLCLAIALAAPLIFAQGGQTGGIQGIVTDQTGAVVPGATITIKNLSTSFERVVVSEGNGSYVFPNLNAGSYSLKAELAGFAPFLVANVTVNVGRVTDVFIKLAAAGTQETVTVTDVAPLIETTKTDVGGVVDTREIKDLPLNGRTFSSLATLIPGARPVGSWDPTKTRIGAVSVAGAGGRNLNTTIDGIDNKDNTVGGYVQNITLEGVQEFALKTQRFSAADGRSQGGLLSIVTKSGSNEFHGSWFTFFRHNKLNANDYFSIKNNADKPAFKRWQYGGSFGGPIKKDKAFFFFTYERMQEDQFAITPANDLAEFKLLLDNNISFYNTQPKPLAQIPQPYHSDMFTARVDLQFSNKHSFYMSWNNSKDNTLNDQGATDGTSTNFNKNRNYLFSAVLSSILTPRVVNQFVFGHSYWNNLIDTDQYTPVSAVFDTITYGTNVNVPQQSYQKKWQFKDSLNWTRGGHTLRFGADWVFEPLLGGFFKYNAVPTLTFFDDPSVILSNKTRYPQGFNTPGIVNNLTATGGDPRFDIAGNVHMFAWYVQDDWHLNRYLTFNLGVRYDVDINLVGAQRTNNNRTWIYMKKINHPWTYKEAGDDTNNFSPRVGFAYDPRGDGRTVIRGGYGMYFDQVFLNIPLFAIQMTNDIIFGIVVDKNNTAVGKGDLATYNPLKDPLPPVPGGLTDIPVGTQGRIINPDYVNPVSQQSNIGFSHQFWNDYVLEVDYTHLTNTHESRRVELNPKIVLPDGSNPRYLASAFAAAGVNSGQFARITGEASVNRSRYDGLNIGMRKRLSKRFSFQTSYTLSKAQGFGGSTGEFAARARFDQFDFLNKKEYGPTTRDERHRFAWSGVIDLPGGIQVSPIFQIGSARPYQSTAGTDFNKDGWNSEPCVPGTQAPNGRACPNDAGGINGLRGGYDLDGKKVSGNLFVMDLRITKFFSLQRVREGMNIGVYFESFNLTNRTNFGNRFSGAGNSSQFMTTQGLATGAYGITVAAPYQAQLGIRFTF